MIMSVATDLWNADPTAGVYNPQNNEEEDEGINGGIHEQDEAEEEEDENNNAAPHVSDAESVENDNEPTGVADTTTGVDEHETTGMSLIEKNVVVRSLQLRKNDTNTIIRTSLGTAHNLKLSTEWLRLPFYIRYVGQVSFLCTLWLVCCNTFVVNLCR